MAGASVADIGAGTEFSWPLTHSLDEEGLESLVFSRPYMPRRSSDDGRRVADRMSQIFSRLAVEGKVEVRYRTVAFLGRPT